jgi:hypothetical protein
MQNVLYHNTGFVPYSGGAIGAADAHILRVGADGGQGVDSATTTAFFNLFPNQELPDSCLSFIDCFLGYKLDANGHVVKMYSATGPTGDAVPVPGAGLPTLLGSTLNGRPGLSLANALLQVPSLVIGPNDSYMLCGVIGNVYEGNGSGMFFYKNQEPGYLSLWRQYGTIRYDQWHAYSGPSIALGGANLTPGMYTRFNFSWLRYRQGSELVGLWNGQEYPGGSSGNALSDYGAHPFILGAGGEYGQPSQGIAPNKINSFGIFDKEELAYRKPIDDFLKAYYAM